LLEISFWITSGILKDKIIKEAKERDIFETNKEKIDAYFLYLDQKIFNKRLNKKMIKEINEFMEGKKSIQELMDKKFPEKKFTCPDIPNN